MSQVRVLYRPLDVSHAEIATWITCRRPAVRRSIFKRNGKWRVAKMNDLATPINRAPMGISDSIAETLKIDLAGRGQLVSEFDGFTRPDRFWTFRLASAEIDAGMQGRSQVGDRCRARICDSDNGGRLVAGCDNNFLRQ